MGNSSKKNTTSVDNPKHNMLWVGILIGVIVAILAVGLVLLITHKPDDNPYVIQNNADSGSISTGNTSYDIEMAQKISSAIANYRYNNNGKFPDTSRCEVKTDSLDELVDEDGVRSGACRFIKNYLNDVYGDSNEFVDANGKPYDLVILAPNVIASNEAHTFYVYPYGRCGNDRIITSKDSFAVSYKASDNADLICVEESLNAYYGFDK